MGATQGRAQRVVIGTIAGCFIASGFAALFRPAFQPLGALDLLAIVLGMISGAALGVPDITFDLQGKLKPTLVGSVMGFGFGEILAIVLVAGFIQSHATMLILFWGPIIVGPSIGGLAGRIYHGGRATLAELMVIVAIVALLSSLVSCLARTQPLY